MFSVVCLYHDDDFGIVTGETYVVYSVETKHPGEIGVSKTTFLIWGNTGWQWIYANYFEPI